MSYLTIGKIDYASLFYRVCKNTTDKPKSKKNKKRKKPLMRTHEPDQSVDIEKSPDQNEVPTEPNQEDFQDAKTIRTSHQTTSLIETQAAFEKTVEIATQALNTLGFRVELESQTRESVSLMGQKDQKEVRVDLDRDGNYQADFSRGYTHPEHQDCIQDMRQYFTELENKGLRVNVHSSRPVRPRRGKTHEKKKATKKAKQSPKTLARCR
jgi:hypothetical protein